MGRKNISQAEQISSSPHDIKMKKELFEKVEFLTFLNALDLLIGTTTVKKKNNHTQEHYDSHCHGSLLHFKPFSQSTAALLYGNGK